MHLHEAGSHDTNQQEDLMLQIGKLLGPKEARRLM